MNVEQIRETIRQGKPTIGTWMQLPNADVGELLARDGYDWVAVDMEHANFGPSILPNIFRGIECGGAAPFARLPEASKVWIKYALEAGAAGLIFPMIESAKQLSDAIDLATYPGQDFWRKPGEAAPAYRGVGFCRANAFGMHLEEYREKIAPNIFIVAQIEHVRAVEQIEEILGHKRLDAIMVGPYDLSGSMGLTGQFEHPDFQAAMNKIAAACAKHGAVMGSHVVEPDPQMLAAEIRRGSRFIAYGIDSVFLWKAAARPQSYD